MPRIAFIFFLFFFIPDTSSTSTTTSRKRKTLAEDQLCEELHSVNSKIVSYTILKSAVGLSKELSVSLVNLRKEKDKLDKTLNRKF